MSSSLLRIRIRCPAVSSAPVQLEGCTAQTTFAEFQALVLESLGLQAGPEIGDGPTILAGFPPKTLDLPKDGPIGSALSDNESVTVRLATQSAGGANPEGGKWGRGRGRSKRATASAADTTAAAPAPTRASTRQAKSSASPSSSNGVVAPPAPARKAKRKGKANGKGRANDVDAGQSEGGVHTLAGPLTPPASNFGTAGTSRAGRGSAGGGSGGKIRAGAPAASAGGSSGGGSPRRGVRTWFGSTSSSSATPGSSSGGGGGAAVSGETASASGAAGQAAAAAAGESDGGPLSRKRARAGTGLALKSEGDIADRLLQAVGGGGKGTADRFFRKAMKLAVDKQYDQSRADARVRAALGGWYTAEGSATQRRLGDGESVALSVSFSKGDGAKSRFEETVDRIPREQVAAVVRMIARDPESREMLKPHNFAGCSPRMFWSLVEYWGGDVPNALRLAAPDVDWSFVDTRDRKPSEKAVANAVAEETARREAEEERAMKEEAKEARRKERERKKRRREGILSDSSDGDQDGETTVAQNPDASAIDEENENEHADEPRLNPAAMAAEARQRAANAALARLTASQKRSTLRANGEGVGSNGGSPVTVVVPAAGDTANPSEATVSATEQASRESAEGEKKGSEQEPEEEVESDTEGLTEVAGEAGARLLITAGVRTLGQLADRDEEELAQHLGTLQQRNDGHSPSSLIGAGSASDNGRSEPVVDDTSAVTLAVGAEEVSSWVQSARGEELDEIMGDIFEGNEDVVEALEEVAVSTPRDLVRLGAFPDALVEAVKDRIGAERFAPLARVITTEAVIHWRKRGDKLLEQRPWLELWVHQG